jgi:amino acid adenylation domain-containing protein
LNLLVQTLLQRLRSKGVAVTLDGLDLVLKAKPGVLSEQDKTEIRQFKPALIEYLQFAKRTPPLAKLQRQPAQPYYPLSYTQQRLMLIDQLEGQSTQYNVPALLKLTGRLDTVQLESALRSVLRDHEQLRMVFVERNGQFVQQPLPESEFRLTYFDLSQSEQGAIQYEELATRFSNMPFQLAQELKMRAVLFRLTEQDYRLLLTFHHIVMDGWSSALIIRDLNLHYSQLLLGGSVQTSSLFTYTDYVAWQHRQPADTIALGISYWRQRLSHVPDLHQLATDRPRGARLTYVGDNIYRQVGLELSAQIRQWCRRNGLSEFVCWQGAFFWLNYLYTGEVRQVFGVPMANRPGQDVANIVGFFVNTLPCYCLVEPQAKLFDWLSQLQKQNAFDQQFQDVPFERLIELLPERSISVHPIFQLLFVFQSNQRVDFSLPDLAVSFEPTLRKTALFDLQLEVQPTDDGMQLRFEFNTDLFEASTISRMADLYLEVLKLWLQADSQTQLNDCWPRATLPLPDNGLPAPAVSSLLLQQYYVSAQQPALICGSHQLSYQQLFAQATRVCAQLQARSIGAGDIVALALPRSSHFVIAVLGCIMAGANYLPLDLNQPSARHQQIVEIAQPALLISETEPLPGFAIDQLCLANWMSGVEQDVPVTFASVSASAVIYTLFTSGTTGEPKGVQQTYGAMANHLWSVRQHSVALNRPLRGAFIAATGFDMSFTDMLLPLCQGGTVVVLDDSCRRDMAALCAQVQAHQIEWLNLPYSLLQMLATWLTLSGQSLSSLQVITSSAEALKITPEIRLMFSQHPACQLINHYGPTETHVVTALNLSADPRYWPAFPSIGHALSGNELLIVNPQLQPIEDGLPGEICIRGASVAAGYCRRPTLTHEKFIRLPHDVTARRVYRTGDRGYFNSKGELIYLGRLDRQVHFRGYRIELAEIEMLARQHPQVQDCAAVLAEEGVRLFVVARAPQADLPLELIRFCEFSLPDYMTPVSCQLLDAIPLNANGKMDSGALLARPVSAAQQSVVEPVNGDLEQALLLLWREVLPNVSADSGLDFFAAGGDSMKIIRLVHRIQQHFSVALRSSQFYLLPTIRLQAQLIARLQAQQAPSADLFTTGDVKTFNVSAQRQVFTQQELVAALAQWQQLQQAGAKLFLGPQRELCVAGSLSAEQQLRNEDTTRLAALQALVPELIVAEMTCPAIAVNGAQLQPFSAQQLSIWLHMTAKCQPALYNMPFAIRLYDAPAVAVIQAALNDLLRRHATLRMVVQADSTGSEQKPHWYSSGNQHWPLNCQDLANLPPAAQTQALQDAMLAQANQPFDFSEGVLGRAELLCLDAQQSVLIVVVHHLACDGYSSAQLIDDFCRFVASATEPVLTMADQSYQQYVAWQQQFMASAAAQRASEFWQHYLAEAPVRHALVSPPPPATAQGTGRVRRELAAQDYQRLCQLLAGHKTTPYSAVSSLFGVLLSRFSAEPDVVFGTLYAGRVDKRTANRVGLYTNTVPVRCRPCTSMRLADYVKTHQQQLQAIEEHQHLTFGGILDVLNPPRQPDVVPYCQVLFAWQNFWPARLTLGDCEAELLQYPVLPGKFALKLDAIEQEGRLLLLLEFAQNSFAQTWINQLADSLLAMLLAVPEHWYRPLAELPWLGTAQPSLSHGQQQDIADGATIAGTIVEVAARIPDRIALNSAAEQLSYRQLLALTTNYQYYLLAHGVQPQDRIVVWAARQLYAPALYLAIWQVGATVVPIDAQYPAERIRHILADSASRLILTDQEINDDLAGITVLRDWLTPSAFVIPAGWAVTHQPADIAYVLYTSGTTGLPKGVCVGHRQLYNFLLVFRQQLQQLCPNGLDNWLWSASPGFDTSFKGLVALAMGLELVVPTDADVMDMTRLAAVIQQFNIQVFNGTLTQFRHLQPLLPADSSLNLIIGGEAISQPDWLSLQEYCSTTNSRALNAYGPTETTINASYCLLHGRPFSNIGGPVVNSTLMVMDGQGQCVPRGAVGELWVSGALVSQGYYRDSAKTAVAFVPLTMAGANSTAYRTGDKVVLTLEGDLLFLGRIDRQIKLRGYRIELAEIEHQCLNFPTIQQVCIRLLELAGQAQLVAYIVASEALDLKALRLFLAERLPAYMVPARFELLAALPLNTHGKVDWRQLPAPAESDENTQPQTATEQQLLQLWQQVFKDQSLNCRSNFFALGGNSLQAMQLLREIEREFALTLPVNSVMLHGDIQSLASLIEQQQEQELLALLSSLEQMPDDKVQSQLPANHSEELV